MGIIQNLSALALRQVVQNAANAVGLGATSDAVIASLGNRFTDHSQRLTQALKIANERAWKSLELALARESLWERCKIALTKSEDRAFLNQVRTFLDGTRQLARLALDQPQFCRLCLSDLRRARKGGLLTVDLTPQGLAQQAGDFARFADPQALLDAEWKAVELMAGDLQRADCVNLARLLRLRPPKGDPLLVMAVRYFFHRAIEGDPELFQGLAFAKLESLGERHEQGFAALNQMLADHGRRLEDLMTDVVEWMEKLDRKVEGINQKFQKLLDLLQLRDREVRPSDSMSFRNDAERHQARQVIKEYRDLPESRRRSAHLLTNVGKLGVATGDFEAAQRDFQQAANLEPDTRAKAEAHHNAYQAALERQAWDEALAALREAVARDSVRFAPFPFSKYEPKRILGAGGFGVVFLCQQAHLNKSLVVKSLTTTELDRDVASVFDEAKALEELVHPAIIRLRDCDYADDARRRPYLVMDYFDGVNLESYVAEQGLLLPADLLAVAIPVAEALRAAHAREILHRDVKPANVLVRREGPEWRVNLIDFGLALRPAMLEGKSSIDGPRAQTTIGKSLAGTLHYAAPEQLGQGGEVGPQSDVYGFGKTCYFALLGTSEPDDVEKEGLPEAWRRFLSKCTGRKLANRLPSFAAVLTELEALKDTTKEKDARGGQGEEKETEEREESEPPPQFPVVESWEEIDKNMRCLEGYLQSDNEEDRKFAMDLVKRAKCILISSRGGKTRIGPSRFVGYANNSRESHEANVYKDGKETNPAISRIVDQELIADPTLEEEYQDFCRVHQIHNVSRGRRKYWRVR